MSRSVRQRAPVKPCLFYIDARALVNTTSSDTTQWELSATAHFLQRSDIWLNDKMKSKACPVLLVPVEWAKKGDPRVHTVFAHFLHWQKGSHFAASKHRAIFYRLDERSQFHWRLMYSCDSDDLLKSGRLKKGRPKPESAFSFEHPLAEALVFSPDDRVLNAVKTGYTTRIKTSGDGRLNLHMDLDDRVKDFILDAQTRKQSYDVERRRAAKLKQQAAQAAKLSEHRHVPAPAPVSEPLPEPKPVPVVSRAAAAPRRAFRRHRAGRVNRALPTIAENIPKEHESKNTPTTPGTVVTHFDDLTHMPQLPENRLTKASRADARMAGLFGRKARRPKPTDVARPRGVTAVRGQHYFSRNEGKRYDRRDAESYVARDDRRPVLIC